MSRKTKRHQLNMENRNQEMPSGTDITNTAKDTLDSVVGTVNNNKILIGSIAGACGAAIFLLATDTGRRIRSGIQTRSVDLYDYVSDQVMNGVDWVQERAQSIMGRSETEQLKNKTRRAA